MAPRGGDHGQRQRVPLGRVPLHPARLDAEHRFIHAGRPQTNGCVERVQRSILDECWKPAFARYLIPKQTGLKRELERFLRDYNSDRAHNGRYTRGRIPDAVLGKAKMFSG